MNPASNDGLAGVTAMETRVGAVTVNVVLPETAPKVAVMVLVPAATVVARPVPAAIVALAGVPEVQVTEAVKSCVDASVNVPIAVNCRVRPAAVDGLAGVTAMETRRAVLTVNDVLPEIVPKTAETVVTPGSTAMASPILEILATARFDEAQVTDPVISCVVASPNVPVAVNGCVIPSSIALLPGVTAMEMRGT